MILFDFLAFIYSFTHIFVIIFLVDNMELLANELRPQKLDDILGQDHIIGKGKIINNLIKNKKMFP